MSSHYPRIRIHSDKGYLAIREGLSLCFYMQRPHREVARAVACSLDTYARAVGPQALGLYADEEGEWQQLDAAGWELTRRELLEHSAARVLLRETADFEHGYLFEYGGIPTDESYSAFFNDPNVVCAVEFQLPTEFLEEHGPERVGSLALELAAPLPFNSGHAGLSFNGMIGVTGTEAAFDRCRFRYPGIAVSSLGRYSMRLGTRLPGAYWMTFLGQPVLGALGGVSGLRSRLHAPETTVQELDGDRAVVTLGPWPEAGDMEQGQTLPAYRELARVLEPWTYFEERLRSPDPETLRRWERRFLD